MYSTCIYCKSDLGRNEVLESFPVGRRLAFDSSRGRLWVVCRRCSRWNLSPLEERWEAVEACERHFSWTQRRVTTENIGLSRLSEGLELIRIGAPLRREFAAWRYGTQLARRRQQHRASQVAHTGAWLGINVLGSGLLWLPWMAYGVYADSRTVARPVDGDGHTRPVSGRMVRGLRLLPSEESASGWVVRVRHRKGSFDLSGDEAVYLVGTVLPLINRTGASAAQVDDAVREIERAGGVDGCFATTAAHLERWRYHGIVRAPDHRLATAPLELRLALEMSAHEETEREAMEGELRRLESAWREAEEIAAIADRLLLPPSFEKFIARYRR